MSGSHICGKVFGVLLECLFWSDCDVRITHTLPEYIFALEGVRANRNRILKRNVTGFPLQH